MKKELICTVCPMGCHLEIDIEQDYKVSGNKCKRGEVYGKKELLNPTRTITSTVKIENGLYSRIPVKTEKEIPKNKIFDVMKELNNIVLQAPVSLGDIVLENVCNTNVNIITTRSMEKK